MLTREDGILDLRLTWKMRTRWLVLAAELGEAGAPGKPTMGMKHPLGALLWALSEAGPIPALEHNYSQRTSVLLPQAVCRCPTLRSCTDRRDQAPAAAEKAQGGHSQGLGCF